MKTTKMMLTLLLLVTVLLMSRKPQPQPVAAQTSGQTDILVEDFANGSFPPVLNRFNFNHSFTLGTAWDLGGSTIGEPLSQTPPFALTLYAGNEDRVTFNQPSFFSNVTSAQVWGWTHPAQNDLPAGRGRVVFEGTGDTKTYTFTGGASQWQLFKAAETDVGDNGKLLGAIVAVRLADIGGNNGVSVMFDDLQIVSVTPPRRSNLTLTMSSPTSPLTIGSTVNYTLTVTNAGPEDAPNVVLEDVLPLGGTFVSSGSTAGCTLTSGQVRCNLGTMAVGASRTVTLRMTVGSAACAAFTNRATVTAQAYDNNMADNTAVHTATTPNPACADFAVTLTAQPVPLDAGGNLTYILTVKNNGPDTAVSTATVTLPASISLLQTTPDSGISCSGAGSPLTCTVGALVARQQKQVVFEGVTAVTATGLQTTLAQVTPALPDPILANNSTRFRFALGTPFDFTLIGEMGVGVLAGYDLINGLDINAQGEVAFSVNDSASDYTDYGVFVGDGQTLTQRFSPSDLPSLSNGQVYRDSFTCPDLSDAGTIAMTNDIRDPALDPSLGPSSLVGSVLTFLGANGSVTPLNTQTVAASGTAFRRYGQAVIDDAGRVVALYESPAFTEPEGLIRMVNGQPTTIYQATALNLDLSFLGSTTGGFAWQERLPGILFSTYQLFWAQETPSGWFLRDVLTNNSRTNNNSMMGTAPFGGVIYSQNNQQSGAYIAELYLGQPQPELRTIATSSNDGEYHWSVVNDNYRYAFITNSSDFGNHGIYVGPNRIAHRVVREGSGPGAAGGDILFGSRVSSDSYVLLCKLAINNAGQIAFAPGLADGRQFIVRAEPTRDNDGDGIPDWHELGAPNFGDGNGDGIPDSVQPNVASVPNVVDGRTIAFTTDPNFTLTNMQAIPNPSPSNAPNDPFPFGFFSFELIDVPPGGSASVEVTLPYGAMRNWWKYGPTPGNPTPHWYEFTYDGTTGAEVNGNVVTLHFVDGQRGDSDLTANGVIVDPGGASGFPFGVYLPISQK